MIHRQAGFTLIELMVVVTIIALLAVAILPELVKSQEIAYQAADQGILRWHYTAIVNYKTRYRHLPRGGGHQFVIDPWIRNVVEHTSQNMDRYFSSKAIQDDTRYLELKDLDPEEYWTSRDELTSLDTNWAAVASEFKRNVLSGKRIVMATDNENLNIYPDGSVVVLYGDGVAKMLLRDPDFIAVGYSAVVDEDEVIEVGPESRHPKLQKLEH